MLPGNLHESSSLLVLQTNRSHVHGNAAKRATGRNTVPQHLQVYGAMRTAKEGGDLLLRKALHDIQLMQGFLESHGRPTGVLVAIGHRNQYSYKD